MKTCKKSFLVLFLAFILCFNTLSLSASADSITGDSYRRSVPAFGLGGYALTFACEPLSDTHGARSINRLILDDAYYLDDIYEGSINDYTWYDNSGTTRLFGTGSIADGEEPHNIIDFAFRAQPGYFLYDYPYSDFESSINYIQYPVLSLTRSNFYINFTLFERFWSGDFFKLYVNNRVSSTKRIYFYHKISFLDDYGLLQTVFEPGFKPSIDYSISNNYDILGLSLSTDAILDFNPIDAFGNIYIVEHVICGYVYDYVDDLTTSYGNYFFRYFQNDLLQTYYSDGNVNSIYLGNLIDSYYDSASLRFTENTFSPFGWFGDIMGIEIFPGFPLYYMLLVSFGAIMFGYLIKIFLGG